MRLATLETAEGYKAVAVHGSRYVDLHAADAGLPSALREILAADPDLQRTRAAAQAGAERGLFITGRLSAPIARPEKVICIGLNYRDHALESGVEPPAEPICFSKFSQSVVGPEDAIRLPSVCQQVDYEAELVVVMGRRGRKISRADAYNHVAGYMNGNDVSARDWQLQKPGKQWLMGKTPDTFAPTGPWIVTRDEVPDPAKLPIMLRLNGALMQNSSTAELIFGVDEVIAYMSQLITFEPGDLIFTGTPPGVGMARKPPVFLKPGDVTEVEIAGFGVLRNPVIADD